ncbi:MAG TPA: polyprenyl synthetase family protein [Candidatus Saccharimonadales bacterium]|nr:polyprenyl synthetase family protein [Candidatus Saccharimonadales bacterium]
MKFDFASAVAIPELPVYLERVEQALRQAVASANPSLQAAISRLLQVRGKRLRPSLVIAAAICQGKPVDDKIISGCVVIELVHLASLVHDDIIDEAESRWNIPTINAKEGGDMAILVGDYLLARACLEAAKVSAEAAELAAATIAILCEGQAQELADAFALDRTEAALFASIRGKTAALLAAACQMGGLCADTQPADLAALGRYGESFGLAFQLVDDVLDFVANPERLGKTVGNDVREGVYTLPLLLALDSPEGVSVKHWFSQPDRVHAELVTIIAKSGAFRQTMQRAAQHNLDAAKSLEVFKNSSAVVAGLKKLPAAYTQWAVQYVVAPEFQKAV